MNVSRKLPPEFSDLEPWADAWAAPSQAARYERRRMSSMSELQTFYDRLLPRMDAVIGALDAKPATDYDAAEKQLLNLALMFIEAAMAVELFHEPDESKAMPASRYEIIEGPLVQPAPA